MLRKVLIGVGVMFLIAGAVSLAFGVFPPVMVFAFWGVLIVLGTVFERVIYKRIEPVRPGAGWQRTMERFLDEHTGAPVTVYIEPVSGERAYVRE